MNNSNSLFQRIAEFLLGHRYYANIINVRGTDRCEVTCHIFRSPDDARKHADSIRSTLSFDFVETVSFRSHRVY